MISENAATVYIVDDDAAMRDSLTKLAHSVSLQAEAFSSPVEFLKHAASIGPGCLLLDVRLPEMSGLALQEILMRRGVRIPVIIMTGHGDVTLAVRAMKSGAVDVIEKPFKEQVILDHLHKAIARDVERREHEVGLSQVRRRIDTLTPRERQVMDFVVRGMPNKQIAARLELSPKTIEAHRAHVMEKTKAGSLPALVRMAQSIEKADAD